MFRKDIKGLIKKSNCNPLTKCQIKEISKYYRTFGINNIKPYWHQYYCNVNGFFSNQYIPKDYFYSTISYALNEKAYRSLMDKNLLDRLFINIKHPNSVIKNINGFYHHNNTIVKETNAIDICKKYNKLLIKPSIYSGGGDKILVFSIKNEKTDFKGYSLKELFAHYNKNFIIQEVVDQHKKLKSLNESSLNTLRIHSYMNHNNVNILASYLRIGSKGNFMDNMSCGGIGCGINEEGELNKFGYYKGYENRILKTDNGTKLEGFIVPNYQAILEKVEMLHKQVPYFKIIAWDMAIDKNENIVLIEYNLWEQAIDFAQIVGGPLFGNFTAEVLKISAKYDKSN